MNRYYGNAGQRKRVHIPEPELSGSGRTPPTVQHSPAAPPQKRPTPQQQTKKQPPNPFSALGSRLGGILSKIRIADFEAEDWILLLILYLMYRDSGDEELLFMLGAMLLT